MARQPKHDPLGQPQPEARHGHGNDPLEVAEVVQLRRIADELAESNNISRRMAESLSCICDALQPPTAQSATLVINQIIKGIKESS